MEQAATPDSTSRLSAHFLARRLKLRPFTPLSADNSWQWALVLVAAAAAIILIPFFLFGQASGHDIDFHLTSWMEVARQWHEGVIFPRWAAGANYGYGEPRFIFYPPLSWLLGAALGSLLPWNWAPTAFIFLCLVLAGLSMHRLASAWMAPRGAVVAALLYAANPYHLVNVYLRSDFAELLAAAIFPLAVHFALRDASAPSGDNPPKLGGWRNSMGLALVYGAIWLSNAPAAVVATYALALLLAVRAAYQRSVAPILMGGAGLALGFALAGIYVIPAKLEQSWVNITQVISPGLSITENYLFTSTLDPEHNLFNLQVSAIAALMLALAGIAAVLSHRASHRARIRAAWAPICALGAASAAMLFPLSGPAWRHLPELQFVQFPWRWLFPLGASMAFLFGAFFSAEPPETMARRSRWKAQWALALLLLGVGAGSGVWLASIAFWNSDEVADDLASVQGTLGQGAQGYEGTDEYCPIGADNTNLNRAASLVSISSGASPVDNPQVDSTDQSSGAADVPVAQGAEVAVETWGPERKIFTVDSRAPAQAALRLLNYPAWKVLVNGRPDTTESDPSAGQMLISVPEGRSRIEVRFGRTPDRTAGAAVSIVGVVLLVVMLAGSFAPKNRDG